MIEKYIFLIRGHRVILSTYLAELYGVKPKVLIQAVKRNKERFPLDFMFRLTLEETKNLRSQFVTLENSRSQIVTLKRGHNIKYLPYAFTEQGISMLSSVLNSKRAIQMNIEIMRTFVKIRRFLSAHGELADKLRELEIKTGKHDKEIQAIFEAIRKLMVIPEKPKRQIGFHAK